MSELIWIGNTLYPRWFVIGVVVLALLMLVTIVGLVKLVARNRRVLGFECASCGKRELCDYCHAARYKTSDK